MSEHYADDNPWDDADQYPESAGYGSNYESYEYEGQIDDPVAVAQISNYADEIGVYCAMISEREFIGAIDELKTSEGESGVLKMVFAIEQVTGWHLEIMGSRSQVDDILMSRYNKFDPNAWDRIRNSDQWQDAIYQASHVMDKFVSDATRIYIMGSMPSSKIRASVRKFLWSFWSALDERMSRNV